MSKHVAERPDLGNEPDVARRKLTLGVLAMLAGSVAFAGKAEAFARDADGRFNAASRLLAPWGVSIVGDELAGHDRFGVEIDALPQLEYEQVVGTRNRLGALVPFWKSSVLGNDASATHFHPGEIVPCVRTSIQHDEFAIHELFDADQGGIVPCVRVTAEMLRGGHFGTIVATHFHEGAIVPCIKTTIEGHSRAMHELFDATEGDIVPCVKVVSEMLTGGALGAVEVTVEDDVADFRVVVAGGQAYRLVDGRLVPEVAAPA